MHTVKSHNYESRNNDKFRNNDTRGDDAIMEALIENLVIICLEITIQSVLTEPYRNFEISLY